MDDMAATRCARCEEPIRIVQSPSPFANQGWVWVANNNGITDAFCGRKPSHVPVFPDLADPAAVEAWLDEEMPVMDDLPF